MGQYTWLDFIIIIGAILIVYYVYVFLIYYYPYLNSQQKDSATKTKVGDIAASTALRTEPTDNPFIKKIDIEEKESLVAEKNINNSNISNNFNNFDSDNDLGSPDVNESSSLNVLNSVFSNLPIANENEDTIEDHIQQDIDLTDILPETQDLDFIDMQVTDMEPDSIDNAFVHIDNNTINSLSNEGEENFEVKIGHIQDSEQELGAYLNSEIEQLDFTFGNDEFSQVESDPIITETIIKNNENKDKSSEKDNYSKNEDEFFDFNS